MKKLSLFLSIIFLLLCSCTENQTTSNINSISSNNTNTNEADHITPVEENFGLNIEVFDDMEKTYSQLKDKYGNHTTAKVVSGSWGIGYAFESGFGFYSWEDLFNVNAVLERFDESDPNIITKTDICPETSSTTCQYIVDIKMEKLFSNITLPANLYDIAKIPNVGFIDVAEDNTETVNGRYNSIFCYDKYIVYIATTEKGIIDKDSYADIYYGPLFNYKIYGDLSSTYSQIE